MHNGHSRRRRKWEIEGKCKVIMTKKYSKWKIDSKAQIKESQRTQAKVNTKNSTLRYIIFNLQKTKDKEQILKEARRGENKNSLIDKRR